MNTIAYVSVLSTLFILTGCSGGTPDCSAKETLDLLSKVVEEPFLEKSAIRGPSGQQLRQLVEYEFRNIKTKHYDEKLDAYKCAATLEVRLADSQRKANELNFEYQIHAVDDRESDFEITYDTGIKNAVARVAVFKSMGLLK
ncbi:hypothetical protein BZL41_17000 [Pseudomonas sp. PIC25]|uniref:hypothetical protein n=1 Tax=Pseudomonas sp. PIC25 TaxID=1958773 RepID=UPI000BAB69E1|nr:hypothetical protein [Pseudomonas sp. PIC25]PAU59199.1 hypothetical protein BZL41_17000 [Pseudomonas sp. PIC25]